MKRSIYFGAMLLMGMCVSGASAQDGTMKSGDKMQMSGKKSADSSFMMMAATSDMNEISLSNQALSKSSSDDVKKFAQSMIDDHTKSSDELKPIAMSKNVTLPGEPDAKHKAAAAKMAAASGDSFDMMFIKTMVKDHEKAVALFQKESTSGKDADAKAFAAKTLPVIQGHLDMARSMMSKMSGKSGGKMKGSMSGDKMKSSTE